MSNSGAIEGQKGRYEVLGRIASGAMGHIHLARHRSAAGALLGEVAIKKIRPDLVNDENIVQMFEDEAAISERLSHPNIVRILEVGRLSDGPFLAMELVCGVNLQALVQRLLNRAEVLPVPLVLEIVRQVLEGLEYAHQVADENDCPLNVVHRDVSPQNIMVSFTGEVKLFDFGVGKARGKGHQTNPGFVKGKLAYMSPEQIRNVPVDARSDLFSVGVLAYEALVLVHPFYGKTDAMLMRAVMETEPPDPRTIDPDFPEELGAILVRSLEKDPDRRFESARTMREALERFASSRVFPPGPSLAELLQDLFQGRVRAEARARKRDDDALLLQAMRGDLDEEIVEGSQDFEVRERRVAEHSQLRGEQMFAELPTADIQPERLLSDTNLESAEEPLEREPSDVSTPVTPAEPITDPIQFSSLPDLLPESAQRSTLGDLRILVEATPTPLFVSRVDDGIIIFANDPMAELFGLTEGALGRAASSLYVNPADRHRIVSRLASETTLRDHLLEMKRADGRRFWASLSVRLVQHHGTPILIGSVADVTQRVEVESRLARRLSHERRLAQAAAALLRTRDADPGEAGLQEALEHLRVGTDADRVVLVQNEDHGELGLVMRRSHSLGVEAPMLANRGRVAYAEVPRWRTLLERGDALRGPSESFPDAERQLLDTLGVRAILAAPVRRNERWLGFIALEATSWRSEWTDDDVAALETMARVLAGELERRRARAEGRVRLPAAAATLVSLGARVASELPGLARQAAWLRRSNSDPALAELSERLEDLLRIIPGAVDMEVAVDVVERINGVPGVQFERAIEGPFAWVRPSLLDRFASGVVGELARNQGFNVAVTRAQSGDLEIRLTLPATPAVLAALDGDPTALGQEGARIGMLSELVEAMRGELRLNVGELLEIVVELPSVRVPAELSSAGSLR